MEGVLVSMDQQKEVVLVKVLRVSTSHKRKAGVQMSIVKRHLAESEERMVLVEEICIDTGALVLDPDTTEMYFSADDDAYKNACVGVSGMGERYD